MTVTKPKTAEELLVVFAEMIQDFTAPAVQAEVSETDADDDEVNGQPPVISAVAADVAKVTLLETNPALQAITAAQAIEVRDLEKTPPAPAPQAAEAPAPVEKPAPWVGLSEKGKQTNLDPSAELHSKMLWLAKTMPGGISLRQLVLDATEKHVNELIAQLYKP